MNTLIQRKLRYYRSHSSQLLNFLISAQIEADIVTTRLKLDGANRTAYEANDIITQKRATTDSIVTVSDVTKSNATAAQIAAQLAEEKVILLKVMSSSIVK